MSLSYVDEYDYDYKIAGFSVFRKLDRITFNRSYYDTATFLSDVGGLECIIILISALLIKKATEFKTRVDLMPQMFYFKKDTKPEVAIQYSELKT